MINDNIFYKMIFFFFESGGFINFWNIIMVLIVFESYFYVVVYIFNGGFVYMDDNLFI